MRIAICISEESFEEWDERKAAVVNTIAQQAPANEHLTIRFGSVVLRDGGVQHWQAQDTAVRTRILAESRVFAAFLVSGCSEATAGKLKAHHSSSGFPYATVLSAAEGDLIGYLENTLPLRYRVSRSVVSIMYTDDQRPICPGPTESLCSMSEDIAATCERKRSLRCADAGPGDSWIPLHNERTLMLSCEAVADAQLESASLMDTIFDARATFEARALQIEVAQLSNDPWMAAAVVNWLLFAAPTTIDALHAAVRAIQAATTGEQAVQAAVSCRRFLEQLANQLFSPGKEPAMHRAGTKRSLDRGMWKNRLWAALEERLSLTGLDDDLLEIGGSLDDILDRSNSAVHHQPAPVRADVEQLIVDLFALLDRWRESGPADSATWDDYADGFLAFFEHDTGASSEGTELADHQEPT